MGSAQFGLYFFDMEDSVFIPKAKVSITNTKIYGIHEVCSLNGEPKWIEDKPNLEPNPIMPRSQQKLKWTKKTSTKKGKIQRPYKATVEKDNGEERSATS